MSKVLDRREPPSGSWAVLGATGAAHLELPRLGGRALWRCPQNGIEG